MKTHDEIKKGLERCSSEAMFCAPEDPRCSYDCGDEVCIYNLMRDALAYIQQLEAERDAYREELKTELGCNTCKHFNNDAGCVSGYCEDCKLWCNWELRGVQKEE